MIHVNILSVILDHGLIVISICSDCVSVSTPCSALGKAWKKPEVFMTFAVLIYVQARPGEFRNGTKLEIYLP